MVWSSVVAVSLSCCVTAAIVDRSMSVTCSMLVMLEGGDPPGLLTCRRWVVGANPMSFISQQWVPAAPLLFGGVKVSIFHCFWLVFGVELCSSVWLRPFCLNSFTAFLENVTGVLKCILPFSLWVMGSAPFDAPVVVDIIESDFQCCLEVKLN